MGSAYRAYGNSDARHNQIGPLQGAEGLLRPDDRTRAKADLTQEKLAKRLKRPQSFIAKYEGGERRIDVVEFVAIAKAMGADPIEILRAFIRRMA